MLVCSIESYVKTFAAGTAAAFVTIGAVALVYYIYRRKR